MKKTLVYILFIVVLASIAVYIYLQDRSNTLNPELTNFALQERERVDSVLIGQAGRKVKLHRQGDRWYVNESLYARENAVDQLFNLMEDIRVEAPAPQKNRDEIVDLFREPPLRVRVYQGKRLIRDYLVEDSEYKKGVTYMMVSGSGQPYLMDLPGYDGDLASLYESDAGYWRERTLFDYSGPDMRSVKVDYPGDTDRSFHLFYRDEQFLLESLPEEQPVKPFSSNKAARYLSYFANVRFHSLLVDQPGLLDSLRQATPYCSISIRDENGRDRQLFTYRKPSEGQKDAFGQDAPFDLNFLYGRYQDSKEILLIKYTEIDPLLKEIDYFREN